MKWQFFITHTIHKTDSFIARQLGYKHTFCQNIVSTEIFLSSYICKNITCLSTGLMRIFFFCVSVDYEKFLLHIYHEGVYGDSELGVSCLVASEDVAFKIKLFSHHICILVLMIVSPFAFMACAGMTLCLHLTHVAPHAELLLVSFANSCSFPFDIQHLRSLH